MLGPFVKCRQRPDCVRRELELTGVWSLRGLRNGDVGIRNSPTREARCFDGRDVGNLFRRRQLNAVQDLQEQESALTALLRPHRRRQLAQIETPERPCHRAFDRGCGLSVLIASDRFALVVLKTPQGVAGARRIRRPQGIRVEFLLLREGPLGHGADGQGHHAYKDEQPERSDSTPHYQ